MSGKATNNGWKTDDPIYNQCECGRHVRGDRICGCGRRQGKGHTYMANGNTDRAGNYAVVAGNYQWASDTSAFDTPPGVVRASVKATLDASGLR